MAVESADPVMILMLVSGACGNQVMWDANLLRIEIWIALEQFNHVRLIGDPKTLIIPSGAFELRRRSDDEQRHRG